MNGKRNKRKKIGKKGKMERIKKKRKKMKKGRKKKKKNEKHKTIRMKEKREHRRVAINIEERGRCYRNIENSNFRISSLRESKYFHQVLNKYLKKNPRKQTKSKQANKSHGMQVG